MDVGDVVIPVGSKVLSCGSGVYSHAIVVCMDPFILVSEEADMRWSSTVAPHEFESVGPAGEEILNRCLERLYQDFPNHKLHQFMDTKV